jgi:hypothetical protein
VRIRDLKDDLSHLRLDLHFGDLSVWDEAEYMSDTIKPGFILLVRTHDMS